MRLHALRSPTFLPCFIVLLPHYIAASLIAGECRCNSVTFGVDVPNGELKSPGFPVGYCPNLDCKYEIEGKAGQSIHLSIVSFDTEMRHDFLEISQTYFVNGERYIAKVAVLTGRNVRLPLFASSEGNGFTLRFVTDQTEMFTGFLARFARNNVTSNQDSCPPLFHEAITREQTLPSPPMAFRFTAGCSFMVNTSEGNAVKLRINALSSLTKIVVYETENYNSQRVIPPPLADITKFTASFPVEVTSRTASVIVVMSSLPFADSLAPSTPSTLTSLFDATFQRTDSPCRCFEKSYTLTLNTPVYITSPGFPEEYCDKLDCATSLKVAPYTYDTATDFKVIRVVFFRFDIENGHDLLHFFERYKNSARYLISKSGEMDKTRNRYFTFDNREGDLRFVTDQSVVSTGFNLSVVAVPQPKECKCKGEAQPLEFSTVNGTVSVDMPASCGFADCFVQINRPATAASEDNLRLWLNVYYKFKGGTEEFLEVLHERNRNIFPLLINERGMATIYESAVSLVGDGEYVSDSPIRLWYHLASTMSSPTAETHINISFTWRETCACGQTQLSAKEGEWKRLTSPDYPSFYCNMLKCLHVITAPDGYAVVVNVTDLALESGEDVLVFFEGNNISQKHIELATGIQQFNYLIRSPTNEMAVYFATDVSITNKGYELFYSAMPLDGSKSSSGRGPKSGSGSSKLWNFFMAVVFFAITIVAAALLVVIYSRRMFCLAERHHDAWRGASVVGFTNINDEQSPDFLNTRPTFR